jgi:hypothetical protein
LSKLKTAASQERPSLWRNIRAVVTQLEKGDLSPEKRRALDADLARIGRRLPGPTSVTESAVQPPAETDAGACPATAPARLTGSYGIVKFVRNGQYAFILPVFSEGELASERQPDVFFRRNATAGQASGELIPNSWYGRWVRFACDSSAPTAASPSAQSVEICDPATVSLLEQELEQRCGPFDRCIGVMTEWDRHRVVVTLGQGNLPVAQDVAVFPSGTLVRFELAGPAPSVIHQLTLPRPADVDAKRQRWLTALAARGTGNRGLDPHVLTEVRSEMLQRYPPTDVRAIRFAGQLHEAIRGGRVAGADLVDAVEELTQQHPELAAWWRATQVYAFLSHHGRSREDQVAFLGQLASELPQWNVRFDSTISQVYRGIMHFIEDYALAGNAPPILTLDDVLDFLKRLQEGEGNRPHFRIEVLRARLGNRLFEVSKQPDYLEQALQCVDNALALNPRLHEAQTLRQSLLAKRPATAWPIARETDSPQVSTELPQAPVRAAGFLAMLYRGFARRPAGVEDASLWFAQVHDRTTGAVRDQLVCEHARLLVQRNQDRKAEQLVHKRLVERAPDLGADRLLRTVQEIWRKSRPTYQEAVERMRAWQRAIPSQERYLVEGILAGIAFDEGNFQLAHVHAQQSDDLAPNVEAQKLLRRS